jgi:peptidoglycan/LPS O-acetylase OafA/YrhL
VEQRPSHVSGTSRFRYIDGLRGVAALAVVLFHAHAAGHLDRLPAIVGEILVHGNLGVPVFFTLSGFVIAHSLRAHLVTPRFFGRFFVRRSLRLDPPYYGAIVIVLAMQWLSARVTGQAFDRPDADHVGAHLVYAQGLLGYPSFNDVFWTLCYEVQFYLVFCLLLGVAQRLAQDRSAAEADALVFVPMAAIALAWGSGLVQHPITPGLFVSHWHGFFTGVLAYWAWSGRIGTGTFVAFCAVLVLLGLPRPSLFTLVNVATGVSLWFAASRSTMESWLNWRWVQGLGLISYSLYLLHNPITGATFFVWYALVGRSPFTQVTGFGIVILACIAGAAVYWWLAERMSLQLARRVAR